MPAPGAGGRRQRRRRPARPLARTLPRSSRRTTGPSTRPRRGRAARDSAGRAPWPRAGGSPRRRPRPQPGRAGALPGHPPLVRVERGRDARVQRVGGGQLDPADDRQREQHRAARAGAEGTSSASSSAESMSSSADAVIRFARRVVGPQARDVGTPRLDRDGSAVGGRGRERRRRRPPAGPRPGRGRPSAGGPAAAARAIGPSPRCRRRGRGSPADRVPGSCRRTCPTRLRARAAASAASRRPSQSALTRIPSAVIRAPARTRAMSDAVVAHPGSEARRSRAAARNRSPQPRVAQPGPQRGAERGGVVRRDEQPRAGPVGAVPERLRHAPDSGGDDREAPGERLGDDHAVASRRETPAPAGRRAAYVMIEVAAGPRPGEAHPVVRARRPGHDDEGARRTPGRGPALPTHRHRQDSPSASRAPPAARRGPCRGHRRDAEQRPAIRCPGGELGRVGARLRPRGPGRRAASTARAASTGPAAGGDHRGGGGEHRASRLRCIRVVRPVAERHVHEHDQPQPARRRHEHVRGRRGDEPVEQHDGAVGEVVDDAGKGGVRRRRRGAASRRAPHARARTSRVRRAHGRRGGRRRCRRSAAPGRR